MSRRQKDNKPLEPITEQQQRFIEALLMGRNITQAAVIVGVSRRTATGWMSKGNPVRWEYDRQRVMLAQQFQERISKIHDLALTALEDLLSAETPPWGRIQALKLIYNTQLRAYCKVAEPGEPAQLLQETVGTAWSEREQEAQFQIQEHLLEDE